MSTPVSQTSGTLPPSADPSAGASPLASDLVAPDLAFYWSVWEAAARRFSRLATVVSTLFTFCLTLNLGLWNKISVLDDTLSPDALSPQRIGLIRWFTLMINLFLTLMLVSGWIDTMRHRVPDSLESNLHNNTIVIMGKPRDLLGIGRNMQICVFVAALILMVSGLVCMVRSAL